MPSRLATHWQRIHPDDGRDRAAFERWQPASVKIITSDEKLHGIEVVPQSSLVVARSHPLSENWEQRGIRDAAHAAEMGRGHADVCRRMADWIRAADPARDLRRVVFTGLNEPHVWADEPPDLTARYYAAFARRLHEHGLCAGLLNLSVGWPANSGPDTPPVWEPFQAALDAYAPGDYLFLHEYWDETGPQKNWGWWAGRYTQCPWPIPIIIGECGVDVYVARGDVEKERRGWRAWLSPQDYMNQLAWYDAELRRDSRIHSAQIFTWDYSHPWASFNVREPDFMDNVFLPYVQSQANVPDPVEPPPPSGLPDFIRDIVDSLPKHPTKRYATRPLAGVRRIVIHHTASGRDTTTPEAIARYHVNTHGWPGSAYHVVITGDGVAYLVNRLETDAAGATGFNTDSVHVTLTGWFSAGGNETASAAQLATGRKVLAWLLQALNLEPDNVTGHRNLPGHTTICPGDLPRLDWWRDLLATEPTQPPSITAVRWHSEEAVREIERGDPAGARTRLLEHVIPALYALVLHERG
jgi:hypothetical protein